ALSSCTGSCGTCFAIDGVLGIFEQLLGSSALLSCSSSLALPICECSSCGERSLDLWLLRRCLRRWPACSPFRFSLLFSQPLSFRSSSGGLRLSGEIETSDDGFRFAGSGHFSPHALLSRSHQ